MECSDNLEGPGKNPDMAIIATKEKGLRSRAKRATFSTLPTLMSSGNLAEICTLTVNRDELSLSAGLTSDTSKKLKVFHFESTSA